MGRWANRVVTLNVATPVPRNLRNQTKEQSEATYEALKLIGGMAKKGRVLLYESDEVLLERLNFRPATLSGTEFDTFQGVPHQRARAPLTRTFVIDWRYTPEAARASWHEFLSRIKHPRFLKLLKATGGSHAADLYHLWEAEHNGLEYFITLDRKFVNAVTRPKPLDTPVKICTPEQFVQALS